MFENILVHYFEGMRVSHRFINTRGVLVGCRIGSVVEFCPDSQLNSALLVVSYPFIDPRLPGYTQSHYYENYTFPVVTRIDGKSFVTPVLAKYETTAKHRHQLSGYDFLMPMLRSRRHI